MSFGPTALSLLFGGALLLTGINVVWLLTLLIRDYRRGELW